MSKYRKFIFKAMHWEYWPSYMFYIPILPYYFYLACKARNLLFFTSVNPSIKNSGNGTESKYETIKLIPEKHRPKTVFSKQSDDVATTLSEIKNLQITYPIIAKPDIGFRGLLVQKINSEKDLANYLNKYPLDIIIQEFIEYENECGIFYHRKPNNSKGKITSITLKKFLSIKGDGKSTIKELILDDKRAKIYFENLKEQIGYRYNDVLKPNETFKLSAIGNHSKGTQFIDGNHLINDELTAVLDQINSQIEGWFYGRLDIKFDDFKNLCKGENFKILEINGIISEPTHVYDATKHSYLNALSAIKQHWSIIYEIANENKKCTPKQKKSTFFSDLKALKDYTKKVKQLSLS